MEFEMENASFENPSEYQEVVTSKPSTSRSARQQHRSATSLNTSSIGTQTENLDQLYPRSEIRRTRNVNQRVKDAVATVSYRATISVPKA